MKLRSAILIVDDEPHIRKFLGMILKELGTPTILEAGNGIEAVATYAQHRPALVLMDINMPQMDGLHALGELQRLDPDVRVVMLTSVATRRAVEEAIDLGALSFVRKDTSRQKITALLAEIIRDGVETADAPFTKDAWRRDEAITGEVSAAKAGSSPSLGANGLLAVSPHA